MIKKLILVALASVSCAQAVKFVNNADKTIIIKLKKELKLNPKEKITIKLGSSLLNLSAEFIGSEKLPNKDFLSSFLISQPELQLKINDKTNITFIDWKQAQERGFKHIAWWHKFAAIHKSDNTELIVEPIITKFPLPNGL